MTEQPEDPRPTVEPLDARREARVVFELRDELEQLRLQLRGRIEAERTLHLELSSALREVEVTAAFNAMLERADLERKQELLDLHRHIANIDGIAKSDLPAALERARVAEAELELSARRFAQEREQARSELAAARTDLAHEREFSAESQRAIAEHARRSAELEHAVAEADARRATAEQEARAIRAEAQRRLTAVEAEADRVLTLAEGELARQRARISVRFADRLTVRLGRHRILNAVARRLARRARRRLSS
jgi:hypothetical protein